MIRKVDDMAFSNVREVTLWEVFTIKRHKFEWPSYKRFIFNQSNRIYWTRENETGHARARTESIHFDSRIFDSWGESKSFFILDSLGRIILFLIHLQSERIALIHFDLVWFWFVANHDSLANQKSNGIKIKGRWIVIHSLPNHWLIRFRIKSE